jgi:GTP cyclohydrolase IA
MEIRNRLRCLGVPFTANDNIAPHLLPGELDKIEADVREAFESVLAALVIDTDTDHNTRETAARVARMYVQEVFKGRYLPPPKVTDFPNAKQLDEIYTVGPITVRSACSHHFVPITGQCWIGVKPGERIIGLSKFNRLVEWVMARPQIQEEAAIMLADTIEDLIAPDGIAVIVKAKHLCMTWRGVKDNGTEMVTSVMRGIFRDEAKARAELMDIVRGQGF